MHDVHTEIPDYLSPAECETIKAYVQISVRVVLLLFDAYFNPAGKVSSTASSPVTVCFLLRTPQFFIVVQV
jgi:hypothetical protein